MKIAIQIEGAKRNNMGDVFQAVAVADHLPRIDLVLDREDLSAAADRGEMLLIANGWYMHNHANFPPPSNITPVYSSVHFASSEMLAKSEVREHLRRFGPIGARDIKTLAMLRAARISSYYSGCFTVAILPRKFADSGGAAPPLLVVDGIDHRLSDSAVTRIGRAFSMTPIRVTHDPSFADEPFDEYVRKALERADAMLASYCRARLVITTKIHCAIPCLAMGVPVILVHPNPSEERLAPAKEFLAVLSLAELERLDAKSVSRGRSRRLRRRQAWIRRFIGDALNCGGNPVALSPKYVGLRLRAKVLSVLWYLVFRLCLIVGFQRHRLDKIMWTTRQQT